MKRVEAKAEVECQPVGDGPRILRERAAFVQPLLGQHRVVVGSKLKRLSRHATDRVDDELVVAVAARDRTVALELTIARAVMGVSWPNLLANYAIWRGEPWPLVLLLELISPILFGWLRNRREFTY